MTNNAGDFLSLARDTGIHPGIIVLRESGLTAQTQYARISDSLSMIEHEGVDLINQVLDVQDAETRTLRIVALQ